ncbi:AraC family transcriptional regulator [Comamonas serinivorans]|uniref:AraC family transcriptional regulator n=1 Tax=Comamonas serinivorans TaxID=1082851 RepID=A0A1Y0ETB8_9BURK|nr:AraC family transcriptional regulator [Comamonas serinivorans]ARU06650.1 AraC family transcriptional regulator [Comamonas serinivorans]
MHLVRGMLEGARAQGRAPEPLLRAAGIAPELLAVDSARVTSAQYIALFRALMMALNDEALGLLSRPIKRGGLELLTRSALGSRDLEAALRRVCLGFTVLQDDVHTELVREGALAGLVITAHPGTRPARFLHEFLLRVMWRLAAWLAGGSLKVQRFEFAFEQPAHVNDYGLVFPASLRFGQAHTAFWFDAKRLPRAFSRDEAAVRSFIASWPASVIAPKREREGMDARVRAQLQHHLQADERWPGLADIAQSLHVSAATLQRQLAASGTSWQALKDELRRDMAIARLATGLTHFATLADELGFSSAAAFQRAFKTWTGSPPGAYRARLLSEQG